MLVSVVQEAQLGIRRGLAICHIANQRLAKEAEAAKKYSRLSFAKYYHHYVKPLIPAYQKRLTSLTKDKTAAGYEASKPEMLPIVAFRSPEVDAQLAAYEISGPALCSKILANINKDQFTQYRQRAYRYLSENTSKQ